MKPIALTPSEWSTVYNKLAKRYEHQPSVILIRSKMRKELGFTVRLHKEYFPQRGYAETVFLDFYNDEAATLFMMTYL